VLLLVVLIPGAVFGQMRSRLPSQLSNYIVGAWVDAKQDVVLIISRDYMVVENQLYNYNDIVSERKKIYFTCVYKHGVKYLNTEKISNSKLYLDEGDKIRVLTKLESERNTVLPESLRGDWYLNDTKIDVKETGISFLDKFYQIDNAVSSNGTDYKIMVYNNGVYNLVYSYINAKGHYLNTNFSTVKIFKKASFFEKHKKMMSLFLLGFVLLIVYYVFRIKVGIAKKNERTKRALLEMELKSIRSQMNPHFLFNALSAIQNLINRNDNEKANHYLIQFAQLMRLTLDKSEKGIVPLEDEIKSIQKYLELEKLRFFFDYRVEVNANVDVIQTEIPAMLIQPFVENAISHGLKEKDGDKCLVVRFKADKGVLLTIIEDNGVGITAATIQKKRQGGDKDRASYGLKLAEDRIKLIKDSYQTDVKIKITDRSVADNYETGTRVEIRLPLKY
jgi:anti-sigma regulatory factor (Ser/Thr protein kinase)